VSEESIADISFAALAAERLRAAARDRERMTRRGWAGVAVVLVHVLIVLALLTANHVRLLQQRKEQEVVLLIPPPPHTNTAIKPFVPVVPAVTPRTLETPERTITVPLPKSQEKPQTDVLEALGKELACGAGPYEHLSQAEREACKRQPWKFKKNAKGVIVLDTLLGKNPTQQPDAVSGADAELNTQQTSDPCLAAGNTHTECIHKTIFGR